MRQINCHIPIKLCITGRLSDAQLDELGEALMGAITARMEQARRTLGEHGHAPAHATLTSARESFDPARLSKGRYGLPSYDDGGKTVSVPVVVDIEGELLEELQKLSAEWEKLSEDLSVAFEQHAYYRRVFILLDLGPTNVLKTWDELHQFIDSCSKAAKDEDDTLSSYEAAKDVGHKLGPAALKKLRDDLLLDEGAAFPKTWAQKISSDFYTSEDPNALQRAMESARSDMLGRATYLSDDIWEHGLKLSLDEASRLGLSNLVLLGLNSERAKATSTEPIIHFTQALLRFERATAHFWLVNGYKTQFASRVESIRKGDVIVDRQLYTAYTGQLRVFRFKLNAFKEAASSDDISKSIAALLLWDPQKFDGTRFLFKRGQAEGVEAFWTAIEKADAQIAGTGRIACIFRAGVWADARGYYDDVATDVWKAIKADWIKIIGTLVAMFVVAGAVQAIPGVNVVFDLVLLIKFGAEGIQAALDLGGALKDAASANSVVEMEHASARLARTLIGAVADLVMWVVAVKTGKIIEDVANWRKVEKFLKTHGDNPATRDALLKSKVNSKANSKPNVEEAEKILAKKQEHERQQRVLERAEQQGKAAEQERLAAEQRQKAVKPAEPAPPASAKPPEPAPPPAKAAPTKAFAPKKTGRTVAEIERDLQSKGLEPGVLGKFKGDAKRMTAAVAKRVEKLMEHLTPEDVKKLGEFLAKHKIALDDAAVDVVIDNVPKGKMSEWIGKAETAHSRAHATEEWSADELAEQEGVTVHQGKPPRTSEIVETPGNEALRASLIKRLGEEPPPGYHAHHIIPEKQFTPGLNWMRERLRKAGSGINDADNGVFLAGSKSTANPELTRLHNSYMHAGRQNEIAYTLTRRLGDLEGAKFLKELRTIGEEMANGKFKTDEIPHGWKGKWQPGMTAPIEPGFEPGLIEE